MTFLVVIHIFICFFLVCVILLQPGKGDAGATFGSSSQSIFGSKGASNFLTKTTTACAVIFLVTSFLLTRARMKEFTGSVISGDEPKGSTVPAPAKTDTSTPAGIPQTDGKKAAELPASDKK